jgi:glycosyltransferase involved in cell wall biosynthesis
MASGLCVIVGQDPAYDPYHLDKTLIKLIQPATDEISGALNELTTDPELRREMATYSRRYASANFSWRRHIDRLLATYASEVERKVQKGPIAPAAVDVPSTGEVAAPADPVAEPSVGL